MRQDHETDSQDRKARHPRSEPKAYAALLAENQHGSSRLIALSVYATVIDARAETDAFTRAAFAAALAQRWPDAWTIKVWQRDEGEWAGWVVFVDDALNHITVEEAELYDTLVLGHEPLEPPER
ncbi:MAG: hypothetical protein M5R40_29600 [Anaerolineae bacterium]|nr:hypothetical protein [Anaerolineae bacterium]